MRLSVPNIPLEIINTVGRGVQEVSFKNAIERVVQFLNPGNTTVLTGAGVSVDSGIRAYRGKDGRYMNPNYKWASFVYRFLRGFSFSFSEILSLCLIMFCYYKTYLREMSIQLCARFHLWLKRSWGSFRIWWKIAQGDILSGISYPLFSYNHYLSVLTWQSYFFWDNAIGVVPIWDMSPCIALDLIRHTPRLQH